MGHKGAEDINLDASIHYTVMHWEVSLIANDSKFILKKNDVDMFIFKVLGLIESSIM